MWKSLWTRKWAKAVTPALTGADGIHRMWRKETGPVCYLSGTPGASPATAGATIEAVTAAAQRREVLALAVPALGALVAEPLFLLVDSAIVGRLGTLPLAGLGVAAALLSTLISVYIFLAYGATAAVARQLGAGHRAEALALGVDGLWLAVSLGVVTAGAAWVTAPDLVAAFRPDADVAAQAVTYLRFSLPGLPGMLVVLAATGVLRGLQDTRTPLLVAGVGALVNAGLNLALVHGLGSVVPALGIAGSGLGTALTQLGMAAAVGWVVVRGARRHAVRLRPDLRAIRAAGIAGVPLLVRTVALRATILLTTGVATAKGAAPLAAHQVVVNLWYLAALGLDALAIAAQALTGRALGAGDLVGTRAATALMVRWAITAGAVLAVALLLLRTVVGPLFSTDPAVIDAIAATAVVAALMQPIAGYVFVLDGVLIGAGDGRYLARAAVIQLAVYVPAALAVARFGPEGTAGLVWLWVAFTGWVVVRAVFLGFRAAGTEWMVTGAPRRGR